MSTSDVTGLINDAWTQYLPVILPTAAIVVSAGVAIYLAMRFAPAVAKRLFRG